MIRLYAFFPALALFAAGALLLGKCNMHEIGLGVTGLLLTLWRLLYLFLSPLAGLNWEIVLHFLRGLFEFLHGFAEALGQLGKLLGAEKEQDDDKDNEQFRAADALDKSDG